MSVNIFAAMLGATIASIDGRENRSERMTFVDTDGRKFAFYHDQDCCETVAIEDVVGDLDDLIGSPLLVAEEVSSEGAEPPAHQGDDSYTWTFYRFATIKGSVTIRWLGESNGYYAESVSWDVTPGCGHTDCAQSGELVASCTAREGLWS